MTAEIVRQVYAPILMHFVETELMRDLKRQKKARLSAHAFSEYVNKWAERHNFP